MCDETDSRDRVRGKVLSEETGSVERSKVCIDEN